ncbi:Uu.00g140050.m01.CDS01 [Anthostomella pinea]|uniref:Uu.00g140050.m01.CDS01 n=1 Tax=Anthostomella pinea TaxID=933095 RepID=A0AAI8VQN5_9PEZI|nr:Uu.00g140050.m01.CDS01 [Anthostomella pinea]
MRPHTPALNVVPAAAGPSSPPETPETPTTTPPAFNRRLDSSGRPLTYAKALSGNGQRANIRPIGGTHFSYSRGPRPEEISPRSSHSSDEETESSASPPPSPPSAIPELRKRIGAQFAAAAAAAPATATIRVEHATFAIEELSDCSLDSDDAGHLNVLRPYGFEYPDSDRSRSRSRPPPEVDAAVMTGIENFNPFEHSDEESVGEEFEKSLRDARKQRRVRRMQSGSIGKRTVSERGSDSDKEDLLPYCEGSEAGSTRRMRRKVGDRSSIQLSGPLPEPIEELKEPVSDEDEVILDDAELFARELPYYTLMEVDSE